MFCLFETGHYFIVPYGLEFSQGWPHTCGNSPVSTKCWDSKHELSHLAISYFFFNLKKKKHFICFFIYLFYIRASASLPPPTPPIPPSQAFHHLCLTPNSHLFCCFHPEKVKSPVNINKTWHVISYFTLHCLHCLCRKECT